MSPPPVSRHAEDLPSVQPERSKQARDKDPPPSHPLPTRPDATESQPHPLVRAPHDPGAGHRIADGAQGGLAAASAARSSELAGLKVKLRSGLRQFPDFPSPGVLFEDIMPLFASHQLHAGLTRALELQIADAFDTATGEQSGIDVIVGLESRGFLFGPTIALRLGAGFVPVRKKGKLPGECATETFQKEYGEDIFEMQIDSITPGQRVVIVDDIIATGGTAAAAGKLVRKLGGQLLGYVFLMELDFLKGRDQLDAPVHTLLSGQEKSLEESKAPL